MQPPELQTAAETIQQNAICLSCKHVAEFALEYSKRVAVKELHWHSYMRPPKIGGEAP